VQRKKKSQNPAIPKLAIRKCVEEAGGDVEIASGVAQNEITKSRNPKISNPKFCDVVMG
jgi:hypothetical protein